MKDIKVYSTIEDKKIHNNLSNSPMWKKALTEEEFDELKQDKDKYYVYNIRFDGLIPKQLLKMYKYEKNQNKKVSA